MIILTKKKVFRTLFALLFILGVLAVFIVENVLPYSGIKPFRIKVEIRPEFQNGHLPSDYGLDYKPFDIKTRDSLLLRGYLIKAPNPRATIILVHGIGDCKEHFYPFCQQLKEIGYQTLIFDARAHGQSEGLYCTFGYYEKNDVAVFIDSLMRKNSQMPVGIYGNSLGGAVALQVLGENNNLSFGIIESTFDEFPKVALEYGEDFTGIRSVWLTHHVLKKSGIIAQFDPFSVKPVLACSQITCPIFMAHGTSDDKIPISFGENNFSALKSSNKQFVRVEGAGHLDLNQKGGTDYWEKMKLFLLKNTPIK
ncbi:MAG: alpha/beta fold hydrolase [Saprospiraceae bacterium]|nr:alpha/beta fold hydrolase [Saprospiraceae bacterium]